MTRLILKITFLMVIFNFCASSDLAATMYELQKTPDDMKNDRMSAEEEANQPTTDKPTTVPNPPTSTVKAVTEKDRFPKILQYYIKHVWKRFIENQNKN